MRWAGSLVLLAAVGGCGRIGYDAVVDGLAADDGMRTDGTTSGDAAPGDAAAHPFAFVQTAAAESATGAVSVDVALTDDVHAGDVLIVGYDYDHDTAAPSQTISDTQGNIYSFAVSEHGATYEQTLAYATLTQDGPYVVSVTLSFATTSQLELRAIEYTGIATTNALDAMSDTTNSANNGDVVTGTPVTTTADNELLVGFLVGHPGAFTAGTGFTLRSTFDEDIVEDELAPTAGSYPIVGDFTNAGATGVWSGQTAAFRLQ